MHSYRFSLGANYEGEWLDDQTLLITVLDTVGASPPEVGYIIGQVIYVCMYIYINTNIFFRYSTFSFQIFVCVISRLAV